MCLSIGKILILTLINRKINIGLQPKSVADIGLCDTLLGVLFFNFYHRFIIAYITILQAFLLIHLSGISYFIKFAKIKTDGFSL